MLKFNLLVNNGDFIFQKRLINFELKKKEINLYFLKFTFCYLLDARLLYP